MMKREGWGRGHRRSCHYSFYVGEGSRKFVYFSKYWNGGVQNATPRGQGRTERSGLDIHTGNQLHYVAGKWNHPSRWGGWRERRVGKERWGPRTTPGKYCSESQEKTQKFRNKISKRTVWKKVGRISFREVQCQQCQFWLKGQQL